MSGYDRYISIFSPDGKIYQVEYAFKAIKSEGLTSIGIRGTDCCVLLSQKKVADKLIDPSTVTHLFTITPSIGSCATGLPGDSRALVQRTRYIATKYAYRTGTGIPVHYLANRVADFVQVPTQQAFYRPFGASLMLIAVDDEKGPELFKCEPSGTYAGFTACASGEKQTEVTNFLEKKLKTKPSLSYEQCVRLALQALQTVVSRDIKPSDVEVCAVRVQQPKVTRLSDEEVEAHLTAVAERD